MTRIEKDLKKYQASRLKVNFDDKNSDLESKIS